MTGRCPRCEGQGHEKLEMYFFEDLYVTCEDCEGRRFKPEVLAIRVRGLFDTRCPHDDHQNMPLLCLAN